MGKIYLSGVGEMKQDKHSYKEKITAFINRLSKHRRRLSGVGLLLLGGGMVALSRSSTRGAFDDFTAGLLMGLGVGAMGVGVVILLLSWRS